MINKQTIKKISEMFNFKQYLPLEEQNKNKKSNNFDLLATVELDFDD
jgi:hypothetical protein